MVCGTNHLTVWEDTARSIAAREECNQLARDGGDWALEFLSLTATRSGEARLAHPSELNLTARLRTIRGERMKASLAHKALLSDRVVDILTVANS